MTIWYVDPEQGSDSNDGSSYSNRCKTVQHLTLSPGDVVRFPDSGAGVSTGVAGIWSTGLSQITLGEALTKTITDCENNWTADASGVSSSLDNSQRQGTYRVLLQGLSPTGSNTLVAHYPLGSTQDYSSYQQITFWIATSAAINANVLSICLCSDTNGTTPVNTLTIPFQIQSGQNIPVLLDNETALGSNIQSIALYVNGTPSSAIAFDNFEAVPAPGNTALSLCSLIGTGRTGDTFYAIRSIKGKNVVLDYSPANTNYGMRGYAEDSNFGYLYKRETVKTSLVSSNEDPIIASGQSGSSGSYITLSGGWSRSSNMSSQTGVTWFDGRTGWGIGLYINGVSYISLDSVAFTRYRFGIRTSYTSSVTGSVIAANNCTEVGFHAYYNAADVSLTGGIGAVAANGSGVVVYGPNTNLLVTDIKNAYSNQNSGVDVGGGASIKFSGTIISKRNSSGVMIEGGGNCFNSGSIITANNVNDGVFLYNDNTAEIASIDSQSNGGIGVGLYAKPVYINSLHTSGNYKGVRQNTDRDHYIGNATISDGIQQDNYWGRIFSDSELGYVNNSRIYKQGATVAQYTLSPDLSDPYYQNNVRVLLHMEGASFTDSGPNSLPVGSSAVISSTQSKFGISSAYFDGSSGIGISPPSSHYIYSAESYNYMDLRNIDCTIEMWVYPTNLDGTVFQSLAGRGDVLNAAISGGGGIVNAPIEWGIWATDSKIAIKTSNGTIDGTVQINTAIPQNQWNHLALVVKNSVTLVFLNGNLVGNYSGAIQCNVSTTDPTWYIGSYCPQSFDSVPFKGYIDEFRITKGIARYTSSFSVPSAAFPDSAPPPDTPSRWVVNLDNPSYYTKPFPYTFLITPLAVKAGSPVTVTISSKVNDLAQTAAKLYIPAKSLPGIDTEVFQSISSSTLTTYTLTFTPTRKGVFPLYLQVWSLPGATTCNAEVSSLDITQE